MEKHFVTIFGLLLLVSLSVHGDTLRLLETPVDAARARIEAVAAAGENAPNGGEILISTFILGHDTAGLMLMASLRQAARRGVKVKIIVDGITNRKIKPAFLEALRREGIEIGFYNDPIWLGGDLLNGILSPLSFFKYRTHDKLFIVDGKTLVTGGRNIADVYYAIRKRGRGQAFIDRDMVVNGPSAADARNYFWRVWKSRLVTFRKIKDVSEPDVQRETELLDKHERYLETWKKGSGALPYKNPLLEVSSSEFVHDEMRYGEKYQGTAQRLLDMIDKAEHSILIDTPYMIIPPDFEAAVKRALARGVKVTMVTSAPGQSDYAFLDELTFPEAKKLRALEVNGNRVNILMSRQPDWMHAKSLVVDGRFTFVGSFNWVARSQWGNLESGTVTDSPVFAAIVTQSILRAELDLTSIDNIDFSAIHARLGKFSRLREKGERRVGPYAHATKDTASTCLRILAFPFLKRAI